jgi:formylglycine-generating enzyme required for sulfatase activity
MQRAVWIGVLLLLQSLWPAILHAQPFDLNRARHAVVRILADRGNRIGSGTLIKVDGDKGYILTAYHVVREDVEHRRSHVEVEWFTEEAVSARLLPSRTDPVNDMAVLVVDGLSGSQPQVMPLSRSAGLRETDRVYALGHPDGGPGWVVTEGAVSRILGGIVYFSGNAVNPGNSGGPLLDAQGGFVGMNRHLSSGLGRALESDVIRPLIRTWVPGLTQADSGGSQPRDEQPSAANLAKSIHAKDGKEMLLVPEGWFEMGSTGAEIEAAFQLAKKYDPDAKKSWFEGENPKHRVWLDGFYMDKYEVTVGEYKAFIKATGQDGLPDSVSQYAPGDNHPVVGVNWEDAHRYCEWTDKMLPTEAQWEKAARGVDGRVYPWGNDKVDGSRANYCDAKCSYDWRDKAGDDGYAYTSPVGSYEHGVSPYGIYDLAGNVWEWVLDWYDGGYYGRSPERNPANEQKGEYRVLRGGGWNSQPANLRAARRFRLAPANRDDDFGFRCVMAAAPRK